MLYFEKKKPPLKKEVAQSAGGFRLSCGNFIEEKITRNFSKSSVTPCGVTPPFTKKVCFAFFYALRSAIACLIEPIALAGFKPFGQVLVQFIIVWQR